MFVRRLSIRRYKGIEQLDWSPSPGLNCLIGPGDSGKTTILAAVALLLSPNPSPQVSEYDYFRRRVKDGFEITAVLGGVGETFASSMRIPALWGWKDGSLVDIPDEDGAVPALHVHVVGTPELEAKHEILIP